MKYVLLVRHAKSSWDAADTSDFDRTLNERGKKDAPEMAHRLQKRHVAIDAFVSSPAKRAKKTAELFASTLGADKKDILYIDKLYHAAAPVFFDTIAGMADSIQCMAIFAHNPGITDFVNMLTSVRTDNMPTCAVFAVTANISSWKEFEKAKKEFWFFDYPKAGEML